MNPLAYPLCNQTVTVYSPRGGRTVLENCYYSFQDCPAQSADGNAFCRKFLLIAPGEKQQVFAGDRIFDGIGPEKIDWDTFLPVCVAGLSQAAYAQGWYWNGKHCHTEAGRK